MKDNQFPLVLKLVLLYAALSAVLGLGFGIDIVGWWAVPVYDGLSAVIKGITNLFH